MINLRFKKSTKKKVSKADSTYSRNFSLAVLNWERNQQENRFAFSVFDRDLGSRKNGQPFVG
jgi:hypothetical protein